MATRNAKSKEAAEICSEEQTTLLNLVVSDVIAQKAHRNLGDSKEALEKVQALKKQTASASFAQFPKPMEKREVERYIITII